MGKAFAIDMHSHYYGGLVDSLMLRAQRPYVSRSEKGDLVLNAMTASTVMSKGYVDLDARLAYLDASAISTQLLTFPGALGVDVLPFEDFGKAILSFNEHLSTVCRESKGRFVGLAGLPLANPVEAVKELHRARRDLGLAGAILPGNYFLTLKDMHQLDALFAAAHETRSLLMIHPGLMPGEIAPAPYADETVMRASALNLQSSLSHMGLSVLAGKLAEHYPNAVFQLVNLGGTLPFIVERMEAVASSREPRLDFTRSSLRGMVYDCASLGPRALELAVRIFGADRVMLGTDYPIFQPDQVRNTIEAAELSEKDRQMVLRGTAERVLDRVFS